MSGLFVCLCLCNVSRGGGGGGWRGLEGASTRGGWWWGCLEGGMPEIALWRTAQCRCVTQGTINLLRSAVRPEPHKLALTLSATANLLSPKSPPPTVVS